MPLQILDSVIRLNDYLLPMFRIMALFAVVPVFGARVVPMRVKLSMAVVLTLIVTPMVPHMGTAIGTGRLVLATAEQVVIGLVMGFVLRLVFAAIETGGHLVGQTMGLGFAQMVDPNNGVTIPVISQFYTLLATLIFLALNGHLVLIDLLVESFHRLPVDGGSIARSGIWRLLASALWLFKGAVLIALPVMTSLLLVNIAFGVVMRASPQLNIFVIGFPIAIMLGFLIIMITLPAYQTQFSGLVDEAFLRMRELLRAG